MTTGQFQLLTVILSAMAVVFIPIGIMLYRGIVKWTRTEDKLDQLITDVDKLIRDKDNTHQAMLTQMGEDRKATDRRLRWLEENVWNRRTPSQRNG